MNLGGTPPGFPIGDPIRVQDAAADRVLYLGPTPIPDLEVPEDTVVIVSGIYLPPRRYQPGPAKKGSRARKESSDG